MSDNLPAVRKDNLPALAPTPASAGLDSSDFTLPKLYRGEYQNGLVQEGVVPVGCIFLASGPDDPAPEVVVKDATAEAEKGVLVHILDVHKGRSWTDETGEFQTRAFNAPDVPDFAGTTYTYTALLPEFDAELPVHIIMAKTSVPTAKRINFQIMKHSTHGPMYELAYRLKLKKRERTDNGQKQRWFVWAEEQVEADAKNVETAAGLAALMARRPNDIETTSTTEPAI